MERKLFALFLGALALTLMAFVGQMDTFFVYMPMVARQPTPTPTNTPTATVTPTATTMPSATPVPTSPPMYTQGGIRGDFFRIRNRTAGPGQDVWFEFGVTNVSGIRVDYGALGAWWSSGSQASYGDEHFFAPGQALEFHEDHLNIPTPGTYQVRLAICFLADRSACQGPSGLSQWQYLSEPVSVTIQ